MRILLVAGSYPPMKCGVGDYSGVLVSEFKKVGVEVDVFNEKSWGILSFFSLIKAKNTGKYDIINIQYPSVGFGWSLFPQLVTLLMNVVITLHEVSNAHWIRKLALLPFSFASKIIFTTEVEKIAFLKMYPWAKSKAFVVPIGSNIAKGKFVPEEIRNKLNICYFGLIRPEKGLENLLELAKLVKNNSLNYNVIIIGQTLDSHLEYFENLKQQFEGLNIEFILNKDAEEVADVLARNKIAYLPFPDGVSERRGSLLAALANDMLVFTTKGEYNLLLDECCIYVQTPDQVIDKLKRIQEIEIVKLRNASERFLSKFSWPHVIDMYLSIFK